MSHSIAASRLSYSYTPGLPVVSNVTAKLPAGQITGIIGPNGAGKSTLLQLFCGLLLPSEGEVLLDGKPLASYSARARARIVGYMPQNVQPTYSLSVREVVELGRYPHLGALGALGAPDHTIVDQCLDQTETTTLAERDFLSLSGGERQRVVLASVLAQEAKLLLLDEPTSALDLPHEVSFFRQLRQLAREQLGIAIITHDINMAAQFCDRLLLLGHDHGLVAEGTPDDVLVEAALTDAYGARLSVGRHPDTGAPFVTVPDLREVVH